MYIGCMRTGQNLYPTRIYKIDFPEYPVSQFLGIQMKKKLRYTEWPWWLIYFSIATYPLISNSLSPFAFQKFVLCPLNPRCHNHIYSWNTVGTFPRKLYKTFSTDKRYFCMSNTGAEKYGFIYCPCSNIGSKNWFVAHFFFLENCRLWKIHKFEFLFRKHHHENCFLAEGDAR